MLIFEFFAEFQSSGIIVTDTSDLWKTRTLQTLEL